MVPDAEFAVEPYCGKGVTAENCIVLFIHHYTILRISLAL